MIKGGKMLKVSITSPVKLFLTKIGPFLSEKFIHSLNASLNYLEVGRWMAAQGFRPTRRLSSREEIFNNIGEMVSDKRVLYLEFGVFKGDITRYWSNILKNRESSLHGFDSFEGLPEDWLFNRPAGYFSTGGNVPEIEDHRVKFFKGWFEDTLKDYVPPPHEQIVIIFDADLYSSTALVLKSLERYIVPGTIIYFDEFSDRLHELKAFREFIGRTGMNFEVVGVADALVHVAFRRV